MSQPDPTMPATDRQWTFESVLLAAIGMIVLIPGLVLLVMAIWVTAIFSLGGVNGFIIGFLAWVLPFAFITGLGCALVYGGLKLRHPVIVRNDKALRSLCAVVLIASPAMILLGRVSPTSALWLPIAALSIVAAIGIVLRRHWPWMVTLAMSIVIVGSWAFMVLGTVLERGWPYSTVVASFGWLGPGMLCSAVSVWCAIAATHLSRRA